MTTFTLHLLTNIFEHETTDKISVLHRFILDTLFRIIMTSFEFSSVLRVRLYNLIIQND